jgi:hypothetical protein
MNNFKTQNNRAFNCSNRHNKFFQPKLTINNPNDKYEQEADAVADKIMRMELPGIQLKSLPISSVQRKCEHCEQEENQMQRKETGTIKKTADSNVENYVANLNSAGQPLSAEVRNFYEPKFGYDFRGASQIVAGWVTPKGWLTQRQCNNIRNFNATIWDAPDFSNVKIHTDTVAAKSAQSINALAYTSGSNIVFNSNQYSPNTDSGKRLLGHELTHVVQQDGNSPQIQRQPFSLSPMQSVDILKSSDDDLMKRQYEIKVLLDNATSCSPQTEAAIFELNQIEAELNSRSGKTFSSNAIERLKKYHEANAAKDKAALEHDSCIVALNKGVSTLQGRTAKELKTTPATIEKTMGGMDSVGLISSKIEINFFDKRGRPTTGSAFPDKLQNSVWDAALTMATGDTGWIVFGLSLMDGNHSITLTLDNNNPAAPKIYWSDQWGSKGGWKLYDKAGLDKEVTDLIQGWWNKQAEGKKFNTVVRLWRLKPYK